MLEGRFELLLTNPAQVSLARQEDRSEGWRADRGLPATRSSARQLRPFVPPRPIQQLRDLTRSRTLLKPEQVRVSNRILKVLEDANLKLSSVMSDVMGVSGREMLRAIMRSETDAAALAALARGRLRGKIPVLQQAATGSRNQHHRFLIEQWMAMWDELGTRIAQLEERIEEQIRPFEPVVETWASLPGIDRVTAWTMVVTGYMLVWTGRTFEDPGADYFDRLDRDRLTKRLVKRLERFGHKVSLQPAA